jgi:hypothetical protein
MRASEKCDVCALCAIPNYFILNLNCSGNLGGGGGMHARESRDEILKKGGCEMRVEDGVARGGDVEGEDRSEGKI